MRNDKYSIYAASNKFYEFDSLKLLAKANSFETDFEKIQFFENVKMEHDIASAFCKAHISLIKKCKKYLLDFEFDESQQYPEENKNVEYIIRSRFTKADSLEKYFFNEQDYNIFLETFVNFFSALPYNEKIKIKIKPAKFSPFSKLIHEIYYDCSLKPCLKKDKKFLSLVKNLSLYSNLTTPEIYTKLTHY